MKILLYDSYEHGGAGNPDPNKEAEKSKDPEKPNVDDETQKKADEANKLAEQETLDVPDPQKTEKEELKEDPNSPPAETADAVSG